MSLWSKAILQSGRLILDIKEATSVSVGSHWMLAFVVVVFVILAEWRY